MAAPSISDEEFVRLQCQLLELRTNNYKLEDTCKAQERELVELRQSVEAYDKELQKATKTIQKSKKAKEVEQLLLENDSLQRKLQSQEDEFRLQNETLMQELGSLVAVNENLEKENKVLKEGGVATGKGERQANEAQDEVRRLQAQNSALQKTLTSCQDKYEEELKGLRQTITELEVQCVRLSGKRGTPVGDNEMERKIEGQSDPELSESNIHRNQDDIAEYSESRDAVSEQLESASESSEDKTSNANTHTHHGASQCPQEDNDNIDLVNKTGNVSHRIEDQLRELNDMRLSLDTEKEEKRMIKEQLVNLEKSTKEQISSLQEEVERVTEKLKKKQSSLVQLQEEKESMYSDLSGKLGEMTSSKERECLVLTEESRRLQYEVDKAKQDLEEQTREASQKIQHLEGILVQLQSKVDAASEVNNQHLQEQNSRFASQLQEVEAQLQSTKQKVEDLNVQLQASQRANQGTLEQLHDLQEDRDRTIQQLQEANKVAEKRKNLLDELAIKYQTESDQHRESIKTKEEEHTSKVAELSTEIEQLNDSIVELEPLKVEVDDLQTKLSGLENTKGWLERRLNETEENFQSSKAEYEVKLEEVEKQHQDFINQLKDDHILELEKLDSEKSVVEKEKTLLTDRIEKLKQEIKDGIDSKKIHEKKGASMLKDLKRQLQQERKRAEKLQERLQEVLSEDKKGKSMDEILRAAEHADRYKGDASSISSWSGFGRTSVNSGDTTSLSPDSEIAPSTILEKENEDLVQRLADLQQEKWTLEEKVIHLEASNMAMVDDLLKKQALITHYSMDSRGTQRVNTHQDNKISLKRVMDFVKDKGDENAREINRKLQHMLEETLTKNMHLQKDLETMSMEVVRLSKNITPTNSPVKTAKSAAASAADK